MSFFPKARRLCAPASLPNSAGRKPRSGPVDEPCLPAAIGPNGGAGAVRRRAWRGRHASVNPANGARADAPQPIGSRCRVRRAGRKKARCCFCCALGRSRLGRHRRVPMQNSDQIWQLVDARKDAYEALSDRVWELPEICYTEYRSVAEHRAMLEQEGFRITENVAGIPTAIMGEAGEGGPVIAVLGEYDALPGLSQVAGLAEPKELVPGGHGHGCGHNMLGAAALLAAAAVKTYLAQQGIKGRVRYYGCPAEEGGAAKVFMVRAGHFHDVDIAITWHPAAINRVDDAVSLANTRIDFSFKGRAAHAAAAPHLGRSALDAVELMNVGVNYMREHMPADARIHYAMIDAVGVAPNVVQARATVRYAVRARDLPGMRALIDRVKKVAEGAALM